MSSATGRDRLPAAGVQGTRLDLDGVCRRPGSGDTVVTAGEDADLHVDEAAFVAVRGAPGPGKTQEHPTSADAETVRFRSGDLDLYGRLRYLGGETPAVVLLCGLGFHTFEYEPLAIELAVRGVSSLSFDFRGHGRSGGPRGRWTLEELAADSRHAIGFLRQRHRGPVALFGNSLGAMIAILAGARDEHVAGVAVANTPARAAGWALATRPRRALFSLIKLITPVAPVRVSVNPFLTYEQLIDDPSWVSAFRHDRLVADARRLSAGTLRALLETWDGPQAVRQLHKPLLVIQGRDDHLQPPRQSQLVFEAANDPKQYQLIGTGHLPHLEAPAMLAGLLTAWLPTTGRSP